MKLSKRCSDIIASKGISTSMNVLFEFKKNGKKKTDTFKYEKEIIRLMQAIFGSNTASRSLGLLKNKHVDGSKACKHTMIVLPYIDVCNAMKPLLEKYVLDPSKREVINIVSDPRYGGQDGIKAYNDHLQDLDKNGVRSVTLTVKKFLTGVSMPLLDSMIYMKNAKSAQEYDQAVFRLCTRNVVDVDKDGSEDDRYIPDKINKKENVYLIDFNMDNMWNMMCDSAYAQAKADGDVTMENIERHMRRDLDAVPLFCESTTGQIVGQIDKMNAPDMMKIYTNYNANKTINDILDEDIDGLGTLFFKSSYSGLKNYVYGLSIRGVKSSGRPGMDDPEEANRKGSVDVGDMTDNEEEYVGDETEDNGPAGIEKTVRNKEEDNIVKEAKKKLKQLSKWLICINLCLEEPFPDIDTMMAHKGDAIMKDMLHDFGIKEKDLEGFVKMMPEEFKQRYNRIIFNVSLIGKHMAGSDDALGEFCENIGKLGSIDQEEHITPKSLCLKMIEKLDDADYHKAESILLVNECAGEFMEALYSKFGIEMVKKCRVVPSSLIAKKLCEKMLKSMGLNDYINDIILSVEDRKGKKIGKGKNAVDEPDGKLYDDFLDMKNENIMNEKNSGKKFDICLMNPPYNGSLHLKFLEKAINLADTTVSVQPVRWLTDGLSLYKDKSAYKKYENSISKYINAIEFISDKQAESLFGAGFNFDVGIYTCNKEGGYNYTKLVNDPIIDKVINKMSKTLKDVIEFSVPKNAIIVSLITGGNGRKDTILDLYWNNNPDMYIYDADGKRIDNGLTFYENRKKTAWGNVKIRAEQNNIRFSTIDECYNFFSYTKLNLFRYIFHQITNDVNVQTAFLPIMDDYKHKWSDEELYNYFDINEEERQHIETVVEKCIETIKEFIDSENNKKKRIHNADKL